MNIQEIDPIRLASGEWCHRTERTIGQGDISASYSADRIAMGQPLRKCFQWKGGLYVCTGSRYRNGSHCAEAYRVIHPSAFDGTPRSYAEKVADDSRNDPNGFYHGMKVRAQGGEFILCGPPVVFVPGKEEQLSLF